MRILWGDKRWNVKNVVSTRERKQDDPELGVHRTSRASIARRSGATRNPFSTTSYWSSNPPTHLVGGLALQPKTHRWRLRARRSPLSFALFAADDIFASVVAFAPPLNSAPSLCRPVLTRNRYNHNGRIPCRLFAMRFHIFGGQYERKPPAATASR